MPLVQFLLSCRLKGSCCQHRHKCLVKRRIYSNSGSEFHPDALSPEAGAAIGPVPVPSPHSRETTPAAQLLFRSGLPARLGLSPYLQRRPHVILIAGSARISAHAAPAPPPAAAAPEGPPTFSTALCSSMNVLAQSVQGRTVSP
jgi:hypothetical protein